MSELPNITTSAYENLIIWLADHLALQYANGRLEGIPALLEDAERMLPDSEFKVLEDLVGF